MVGRRLVTGLMTVMVVTLAAGCDADASNDATAPSASASGSASPTLTVRAAAERDALAAYVAMWQAMATAATVPDPDAPAVRQYATGRALARIVDVLYTYQQTGVVTRGAPVDNARATGATPAEAPTEVTIADCGDSTHWTKHNKATGELIPDDPRGRRAITAVVVSVDGGWKVTSFDVGDLGTC